MNIERKQDVEVYIETCDEMRLLAVLGEMLGAARAEPALWPEHATRFYDFLDARMALAPSAGDFTSCWLWGNLPWTDDVIFARALFPRLRTRIFCDPGTHYPEVHPLSDAFLLIDADGERIVDLAEIVPEDDEDAA